MTMTVPGAVEERDEELAALDGLATEVQANADDERLLARRIGQLRRGRAKGRPWSDLLAGEQGAGVLELVGRILRRITGVSGALRRALARGLRLEGVTVPAIAAIFGVSHQRVSALLHRDKQPPV